MIRFCLFCIVAVLMLGNNIKTVNATMFDATEFVLDNGLRVVVVPNHKAPIVRQMLWYKVGAADEQIGKGGVAHLLEHLMFRGTKKVGKDEYNRIVQVNGIDGNAFTSSDFTVYYQTMDISKLELAMFLEADRMANLNLSKENFALERDIVFQERKQVVENNPIAPFSENINKIVWGEHPYSRPVTGMPEEIMNLDLSDVKNFYRKYYVPNNAILVLAGDIKPDIAKILADKYFGKLKKIEIENKTNFPKVEKNGEAKLDMSLPRISSVRVTNNWVVDPYEPKNNDIYKLSVLSKYLGEGETSALYKKLVKEKKIALAVDSSYDYDGRSYNLFSIGILPADGVSAEQIQAELDKAVAEAIEEIDVAKIENTKHKMLASLIYLRDNPNLAANLLGSMIASGMPLDEVENYAENISAVEADDVKNIAINTLNKQKRVLGVIKPIGDNHD